MNTSKMKAAGPRWLGVAAITIIGGLPACSKDGPARPQLIIVIDTDAPVAAQIISDASLSGDAAVDTLRIDRVDDKGNAICSDRTICAPVFVAPDPVDWPISWGVETPPGTEEGTLLHLRFRLFKGSNATEGSLLENEAPDPPIEVSIDRLVSVELPSDGVQTVSVFLSADCIGSPISLLKPWTTCVDAGAREEPPSAGLTVIESAESQSSRVGTWPLAREVRCSIEEQPAPGAVCIRGGFTVLGDPALTQINLDSVGMYLVAAAPLRPVYVDPFWMDVVELTVGHFNELLGGSLTLSEDELPYMPDLNDPLRAECTWLGAGDDTNDNLPLNCVSWAVAQRICEAKGGTLPTEAQWEHAARGRGQGRSYPWGDAAPTCCATSASRKAMLTGEESYCNGEGPEPVGSHKASELCGGIGDSSMDQVLDLGGSMSEFCLDKVVPYSEGCWSSRGVFMNPRCDDSGVMAHSSRGGNWASGLVSTHAAFRQPDVKGILWGLRCVYPDVVN